ncbi:MAG: FAD-dependent oxidoreductase [Thermoleophilia bacterium]
MSERLLILGNSAAAIAAVRAYRARGGEGAITLVSRETCDAYSPVLTTYYLRGQIPEEKLYVCDGRFYEETGIERIYGKSAVALDTKAQTVALDDGATLSYDKLLIATGAAPRRLDGVADGFVDELLYLRTMDDARRIRVRAEGAQHIVVVGAGLVSLQVAAALAKPGRRITAVVASGQILSQNVDGEAAAMIQRHLEASAPIGFIFGANVQAIERARGAFRLALDTGEELIADEVMVGKGVTPNLGFVDRASMAVGRGIRVDERLRTTAENVWAAGDVSESVNRLTGLPQPVRTWTSACEQGRIAGMNLAGTDATYAGSLPENVTTFFGLRVASLGLVKVRDDDTQLRELTWSDGRGGYRKLMLEGERLVGALLVGDITDAGVLRDVIAGSGVMDLPEELVLRGGLSQADRLKVCREGR